MKTWKLPTAGVLSILTGALSIFMGIVRFTIQVEIPGYEETHTFGLFCILTGIIAIAGGIFAVRRRFWGLALAGAICALFPSHPYDRLIWTPALGVLSIVFLAFSRGEFQGLKNTVSSAAVSSKPGKAIWLIITGLLVTIIGFGIELNPLGIAGLVVLLPGIVWFIISNGS